MSGNSFKIEFQYRVCKIRLTEAQFCVLWFEYFFVHCIAIAPRSSIRIFQSIESYSWPFAIGLCPLSSVNSLAFLTFSGKLRGQLLPFLCKASLRCLEYVLWNSLFYLQWDIICEAKYEKKNNFLKLWLQHMRRKKI